MSEIQLELVEKDDAGNIQASYVQTATSEDGMSRVDVILPSTTKSAWQKALDIFLPAGYPHSVTDDYTAYQIYDSLQAFSSSIAGLLSSRAVLSSVGVGDASASPTAALLLSILQESAGRIATIAFAHRFGTALEPECKMYRLLADVLNDVAFVLDCLSPGLLKAIRVIVLSFSSVLRALCGVAAGSAKASLSAHFARWGNLGELNAKDSSQETVISLLGMLVGSLVVSWITTPFATWTTLVLLLAVHLETNRRAVRAVSLRTLNRQRATLVYHHLCRGSVPSPKQVSNEEKVFERDGVLRSFSGRVLGCCKIGVPLARFISSLTTSNSKTQSSKVSSERLPKLWKVFQDETYVMWYSSYQISIRVDIVVKDGASNRGLLKAWWQALVLAGNANVAETTQTDEKMKLLKTSAVKASDLLNTYEEELKKAGWDLDAAALETTSSTRVSLRS